MVGFSRYGSIPGNGHAMGGSLDNHLTHCRIDPDRPSVYSMSVSLSANNWPYISKLITFFKLGCQTPEAFQVCGGGLKRKERERGDCLLPVCRQQKATLPRHTVG